uniref:HDC19372 n=1 Tax=Drosophila melanogaster TaxID=7227 RepID=Q6II96_DROME|nr:TPA_inf: HDC19372 [Drosophila melanogaster]
MATLNKFTKTLSIDEKAEIKEKFIEARAHIYKPRHRESVKNYVSARSQLQFRFRYLLSNARQVAQWVAGGWPYEMNSKTIHRYCRQ